MIGKGSAIASSPAHPEVRRQSILLHGLTLLSRIFSTSPADPMQVAFIEGIDAGDHHEQTAWVTVDGGQSFHQLDTPFSVVGVRYHPRLPKYVHIMQDLSPPRLT